ncbi:hypothetical protein ACRALDRAFT_2046687 [Sodiomyces alcalophilus JCM 7366]|uniref:uncharacterized protein n=1 Tax=Sodiomyces alcalophilus JCM 7366 TaxID=591952 RepID=UPI0039B4BA89
MYFVSKACKVLIISHIRPRDKISRHSPIALHIASCLDWKEGFLLIHPTPLQAAASDKTHGFDDTKCFITEYQCMDTSCRYTGSPSPSLAFLDLLYQPPICPSVGREHTIRHNKQLPGPFIGLAQRYSAFILLFPPICHPLWNQLSHTPKRYKRTFGTRLGSSLRPSPHLLASRLSLVFVLYCVACVYPKFPLRDSVQAHGRAPSLLLPPRPIPSPAPVAACYLHPLLCTRSVFPNSLSPNHQPILLFLFGKATSKRDRFCHLILPLLSYFSPPLSLFHTTGGNRDHNIFGFTCLAFWYNPSHLHHTSYLLGLSFLRRTPCILRDLIANPLSYVSSGCGSAHLQYSTFNWSHILFSWVVIVHIDFLRYLPLLTPRVLDAVERTLPRRIPHPPFPWESMLTSLRFWGAERGSDKFGVNTQPMPVSSSIQLSDGRREAFTPPSSSPVRSQKRSRRNLDDAHADTGLDGAPAAKRARVDASGARAESPSHSHPDASSTDLPPGTMDMENARDIIRYQFGLEILLKHNELRLINQELAKCQVALEQLRRCHLMPYPTACPTPDQMLEISSGEGPALRNRPDEPVPQWAPPFGVVDGPYARHYAKWLIPDPKFDGMLPEWPPLSETGRTTRNMTEGRITRNSVVDTGGSSRARPPRGTSNQKLQSLSTGYPQPKEKAGPCILKRADGQTVKLVCIDCQRENFSSTQGFINHCRIAHRRDFKSHEEAAVHCGHVIQVDEKGGVVAEEKDKTSAVSNTPPSGLVHPFAQPQLTDQQAYLALLSRINASLDLYHQGKLPGVTGIPTSATNPQPANGLNHTRGKFVSASETPFLSRLMGKRKFQGNLADIVSETKQKISLEDMLSPADDSEETDNAAAGFDSSTATTPAATRAPITIRVPARTTMPSGPQSGSTRPASRKGRSHRAGFAPPPISVAEKDNSDSRAMLFSDEDVGMDANLSPNTLVSNNAPSLVSDDGEYDESDDASSVTSENDALEAESVSDVAEINIEEDHEPRSLRHHRTTGTVGSGTAMRLKKKEETNHVTLVNPCALAFGWTTPRSTSTQPILRVRPQTSTSLPLLGFSALLRRRSVPFF